MPSDPDETIQRVNILIRMAKAYSEDEYSLEIIVDPWYLLQNGTLTFKKSGSNWLIPMVLNTPNEEDAHHEVKDTALRDGDNEAINQPYIEHISDGQQLIHYSKTNHEIAFGQIEVASSSKRRVPVLVLWI